MREYVVAPPSVAEDVEQLRTWLARALAHVSALPPKVKKAATKTVKVARGKSTGGTKGKSSRAKRN
jgi:hypothetical protein